MHAFVSEVCSNSFAEQLRARNTDEEKHELLDVTFSRKVVTSTEVHNRVDVIASELGTEIDGNWHNCCDKIAKLWKIPLNHSEGLLDIMVEVDRLIEERLQEARRKSYPLGQRPAVSERVSEIGKKALLLLPVAKNYPVVGFPIFVVAALEHLWAYITDKLTHRVSNYQESITDQLAILGNRVGSEFEKELRKRLSDLHYWQQQSIRTFAKRKSHETVPLPW